MATKTQIQNFINTLSKLAMAERKRRKNWVLPSVCIAQAALETGWGTSAQMKKAKAYFGIKATSSWKGKVYNASTKECYDGVSYTNIEGCFRAYDNLADSVADYYNLITKSSRYKAAVNEPDAKKAITAIKNGGYCTDPKYINNIMSIIKTYNLTQYDVVAKTTTKTSTNAKVKEWQVAAIAEGFKFASGADGIWGKECETVAKKAICKKRLSYKYKNLTKIVQRAVGVTADGKFGTNTKTAVMNYQKKNKLTVDGAVGLNTWKKILGVK